MVFVVYSSTKVTTDFWDEFLADKQLYAHGEKFEEQYQAVKKQYEKGEISTEEYLATLRILLPKVESYKNDLEDRIYFLHANHHYMDARDLSINIKKEIKLFSSPLGE